MKKFLSEFKEFAMRGNVLDMAIGVVIGGAFGKITTSLVNDVFMPLIGLLIGGIDLGQLDIVLKPAVMNGRQGGHGCRDSGHRHLPDHRHRLHSGGVRHLPDGQGHQPASSKKKDEAPAPEEPEPVPPARNC